MGNCACLNRNGDVNQVEFNPEGKKVVTLLKSVNKNTKLDEDLLRTIRERLSNFKISVEVITNEEFNHILYSYNRTKEVLHEYEERLEDISLETRDNTNLEMPPLKFINQNEDGIAEYYQGEYNNKGEFSGIGIYISNRDQIYYGEFKEDEYNGRGLFLTNQGSSIYGDWKNGKCTGKCILIIKGQYKYIGDFLNNIKDGEGEEEYNDGSKFKGKFKNGLKSGLGKYIFSNGESYEGNFENDLFNGEGTYIWPKENRKYIGQFKNNIIEGNGISTFGDGSIYNGHYFSGVKQGKGIYTWPDGRKFYGNWINNEVHGNGYYILGDEKYDIIFRFGKLISSKIQNTQIDKSILKIENIVNINSINDVFKYICPVCYNVFKNPQKCKGCSTNYCYDCVNGRNKLVCKRCKGSDYETNSNLIQELISVICIKCEKCNQSLKYQKALDHYHMQ